MNYRAEKVVYNHVILDVLFKYLPAKKMRLVCKEWNIAATKQLQTRSTTHLMGPVPIMEFCKMLSVRTNPSFPLPFERIHLFTVHLEDKYLQQILREIGPNITYFELEICDVEDSPEGRNKPESLKQLLSHQLPKLQQLTIFCVTDKLKQCSELFDSLSFENLNCLSISDEYSINLGLYKNIIQAASRKLMGLRLGSKNLIIKVLKEVNLRDLRHFSTDVSRLFAANIRLINTETITLLAKACPKLTELSIELQSNVSSESISHLLLTIAPTIEALSLRKSERPFRPFYPCFYIPNDYGLLPILDTTDPDVVFPNFPKLKRLTLFPWSQVPADFFEKSPKLKECTLQHHPLLLHTTMVPHVNLQHITLPIGGLYNVYVGRNTIVCIANQFPNLKSLKFCPDGITSLNTVFSRLVNLEELNIAWRSLDSLSKAITGLPEWLLDEMEITQEYTGSSVTLHRNGEAYIGCLKKLQRLVIETYQYSNATFLFGIAEATRLRSVHYKLNSNDWSSMSLIPAVREPLPLKFLAERLPYLVTLKISQSGFTTPVVEFYLKEHKERAEYPSLEVVMM